MSRLAISAKQKSSPRSSPSSQSSGLRVMPRGMAPASEEVCRTRQQTDIVDADELKAVEFADQTLAAARQRGITEIAAIPEVGPDIEAGAAAQLEAPIANCHENRAPCFARARNGSANRCSPPWPAAGPLFRS